MAELHIRASQWYEDNGLEIEAFQHAAAANDIERAERLIEGREDAPALHGAVTAILDWLESLPTTVLDARPWLWVMSATLSLIAGQTTGVEEKLQAAEAALLPPCKVPSSDDKTRDLIGQIAAVRATLALTQYQPETMIAQARRALEYLHPDNLPFRSSSYLDAGVCLPAPGRPCRGQSGLYRSHSYQPGVREYLSPPYWLQPAWAAYRKSENQLYQAAETYRRVLQLVGDQPLRMPAKRILAWPASSTNGTIWMPPSSTGSRAFNWHGSMIKRLTDSLSAKCSWPA